MTLRKLFLSGSVAFATIWMSACGSDDGDTGGSGGQTASGGGGNTPSGSFPSDATASGITSFIADGKYRTSPWQQVAHETDPYGHGDVRVYLNDVLLASLESGNGQNIAAQGGTAHDTGSMTVKELLDDGEVVGLAVMLKREGGFGDWAYYCEGPSDRCQSGQAEAEYTAADPFFATDALNACAICHGGMVFTGR